MGPEPVGPAGEAGSTDEIEISTKTQGSFWPSLGWFFFTGDLCAAHLPPGGKD